ncbi:MAG TPA: AAA family ATPase, partial [Hyphomicrobiales bacterium]|nr:AAA family ATPase [Hyphomicrobiales bacterium]
MKLTRLRLAGFKTFVDPTEVIVADGLTGIVGPNGCGKSNLVEALRWVMGESSHRALRAADMEEVIFAGTTARPSRNHAEVVLAIDNRAGTAPGPFAGEDEIEVSRRIERDKGSTYRINGREARARDVQLLFADAASGARSAGLVHQGQIGEIIAAKPEARRRVLEEAAGIAGLHARRHEAELKLAAAEQNLDRVEDLAAQLQQQIDGLKRQARQATRYRQISAEIRRLESALARRAHVEAAAAAASAGEATDLAARAVADRTADERAAARAEAEAAQALPPLRDGAAAAAAALERLRREGQELDREEARARSRLAELKQRAAQLEGDLGREQALARDAAETLARLAAEVDGLSRADKDAEAVRAEAARRHELASAKATEVERALTAAAAALAEHTARRTALARNRDETAARSSRLAESRRRLVGERETAERALAEIDIAGLDAAVAATGAALAAAEEALVAAEAEAARCRAAAAALSGPATEAEAALRRREVERDTLAKLLRPATAGAAEPVSAALRVSRGYEAALAAALGDDLEAPTDPAAPAHWLELAGADVDPVLPEGVEPLAAVVKAPAALARRLAQVGVVAREAGPRLQGALRSGQRLVSREGDLWRWDGYTVLATAETAAARRLVERARLAEIEDGLEAVRAAALAARSQSAEAEAAAKAAVEAERAARERLRPLRQEAEAARQRHAEAA